MALFQPQVTRQQQVQREAAKPQGGWENRFLGSRSRNLSNPSTSGTFSLPSAPSAPAPGTAPAPAYPAPAPAPSGDVSTAELDRGQAVLEQGEQQRQAAEAARRRQEQLDAMRRSIQEAPLDPGLLAQFAARERAADRSVQGAEIAAQQGRERARMDFEQFLLQLDEQRGVAVGDLRGEAAARNLAFQPAFVGVGMRDIRDDVATAQGQATDERTQILSAIGRQVDEAGLSRDNEVAAIARDRARAQSDHESWIQTQLGALQ